MSIQATVVRACREAAMSHSSACPFGAMFPNELYTNAGKYERKAGPQAGTRIAEASATAVETWERRNVERNWRIVDAVLEVADEAQRTPAQVAVNWVLTRPGVAAPIVGARHVEQLEDSLGAVGWRLHAEQLARLDEVSAPPPLHPYDFIAESQRSLRPAKS